MKKVFISLFICLGLVFVLLANVKVSAATAPTMIDGASVRTTGEHQGIKFSAHSDSLGDKHGFFVALGTHTKDAIATAVAESETTVGGKKLRNVEVEGEDEDFHLVVYNIPSEKYGQLITALAYVKEGDTFKFATASVTRNIADVARDEYNNNETPEDLVSTVAEASKVKVTHSNSTVNYYGTLAAAITATFAEGDTVDLVRGTYSDNLTVSVNNFTLKGNIEYNLKHNDTYSSSFRDTILDGVVTTAADEFDLSNVVFSKKIDLNGANNTAIHNCVSTTTNATYYYAIGTTGTESSNLTVENVAIAGNVNRFVYGYGAIINGLTVNNCCVLDSVTINSGSSVGICDFIRLGQTTDNKSAGTITVSNCYIRAFQSGFTDRKAGGDEYNFINNYFYDMPNAIYSKNDSAKAGIVYNITYNTFNNCLKSDKGWDVVEIDPSSNKTVNVNYNAFANTGTGASCYSISVLSTATKDCSNNYFKGDADRVVNNVTPTDWSLEEATTTVNTYDPYQIVQIAGHYYIYGVNLTHVDE